MVTQLLNKYKRNIKNPLNKFYKKKYITQIENVRLVNTNIKVNHNDLL